MFLGSFQGKTKFGNRHVIIVTLNLNASQRFVFAVMINRRISNMNLEIKIYSCPNLATSTLTRCSVPLHSVIPLLLGDHYNPIGGL